MKNFNFLICLDCLWQGDLELFNLSYNSCEESMVYPCCESNNIITPQCDKDESEEFLFI